MKDIFGKALLDFYTHSFVPPLLLHNEYGAPEQIPIERYFIEEEEYSELEFFALQQVYGKILDVGSATGRHAKYLQDKGFDISAMDISKGCCMIMEKIGIKKIIEQNILYYNAYKFHTILMLMNGIGIAGSVDGLKELFFHLKKIVQPDAQLLIDSSDITYLFEDKFLPKDNYFGELSFEYEYKGEKGDSFKWLYIDQEKLMEVAIATGWQCQIIFEDESDAYLARLKLI